MVALVGSHSKVPFLGPLLVFDDDDLPVLLERTRGTVARFLPPVGVAGALAIKAAAAFFSASALRIASCKLRSVFWASSGVSSSVSYPSSSLSSLAYHAVSKTIWGRQEHTYTRFHHRTHSSHHRLLGRMRSAQPPRQSHKRSRHHCRTQPTRPRKGHHP